MLKYIINRLLQLIPTVLGVVSLVFLFIHIVPGDPIDILLGDQALQTDREAMRETLGLNLPLGTQYVNFLTGLMHLDLGTSFTYNTPVLETILNRVPATFILAIVAIAIAFASALVLGIWAAYHEDKWQDRLALAYSSLLFSVPSFWAGPLLMIVFCLWLGWLPVGGYDSPASIILPAFTLSMAMSAMTARLVRMSVLENVRHDYMRTALAKGLSKRRAFVFHALKNAMLPVITVVFLQAGVLLTGAILVEAVFSWPGIGTLLMEALNSRDYPMVQGCILFISMVYMLMTLISDILYAFLDPRIRVGGVKR